MFNKNLTVPSTVVFEGLKNFFFFVYLFLTLSWKKHFNVVTHYYIFVLVKSSSKNF